MLEAGKLMLYVVVTGFGTVRGNMVWWGRELGLYVEGGWGTSFSGMESRPNLNQIYVLNCN